MRTCKSVLGSLFQSLYRSSKSVRDCFAIVLLGCFSTPQIKPKNLEHRAHFDPYSNHPHRFLTAAVTGGLDLEITVIYPLLSETFTSSNLLPSRLTRKTQIYYIFLMLSSCSGP